MKLSIVIPVFNEERTIKQVLEKIKDVKLAEKEIIIVNDASRDKTVEILEECKKMFSFENELRIITHEVNRGKGASIRTGLKYVTGDYVIIQDADLEYDPNDYIKLVDKIQAEQVAAVFGSRFLGMIENMAFLNYVANKILTLLTNRLFGCKLTDACTCYKLFDAKTISNIELEQNGFNFCHEVTVKLLRLNQQIVEVPIWYSARSALEGKKVGWKQLFRSIACLIKYKIKG